jgi:hypothetical protein
MDSKIEVNEMPKKIEQEVTKIVSEMRKTAATMMASAFGFVAALVWRDAIRAFVMDILGIEWGVNFIGTVTAALAITALVVIATYLIGKFVAAPK